MHLILKINVFEYTYENNLRTIDFHNYSYIVVFKTEFNSF